MDVALDAGLSTATVSRALNEPRLVKENTLARVRESVARLDYKPNVGAQLLAKGNSGKTICFMLANRPFVHSLHAQVLQGAAVEAEAQNACVLYVTCNYSPADAPSSISVPRILTTRGLIDGVIAAGTNYANIVPLLEDIGLPYVLFGTNMIAGDDTVVPSAVYTDDEGGGYQATRHLIELGHKKLRFVGDISLPWYRRRYLGYAKAVMEVGLPCEPPVGSAYGGEIEMGCRAVNDLCRNGAEFTALFVAGDEGAVGAIRALRSNRRSVPDDVSVIGFNDEECAQMSEPQLTTISVPKQKAGAECVRMLQRMISSPAGKVEPVVLPAKLVMRESTREEKSIV
ncbi:MAG: LacI family DNA-binding transcriptional regulator [Armatimonadota bacterium]